MMRGEHSSSIGSGSYLASDITFLLRPQMMSMMNVLEKERLIQSGERHYSEMLSAEALPSTIQMHVFEEALERYGERLALEVLSLSCAIQSYVTGPIVLISLVRAGIPLGVLLQRTLVAQGRQTTHYAMSILKGRGLDDAAFAYVQSEHPQATYLFVDGWTGKGSIARTLYHFLAQKSDKVLCPYHLVTLSDPSGYAWLSASQQDWLIPSGILGNTISGLVSRSIWNAQDWHGCVYYQDADWRIADVSLYYVDRIFQTILTILQTNRENITLIQPTAYQQQQRLRQEAEQVIQYVQEKYQVGDAERIKPTIAEATRAVLRRVPDTIILQDCTHPDMQLLLHLAQQHKVPIVLDRHLGPYQAITIIQEMFHEN